MKETEIMQRYEKNKVIDLPEHWAVPNFLHLKQKQI
jgi:hypothetical protein